VIAGLALLGCFVSPARALAGPEEALRAESLFRSGKEAYQRGDYATACPRLAESQRLEPAGGTLLTLALCYEAWGKNATAWALFQQAEAVARGQGRIDRVALARERAQALEPGLSFVTVQLAAGAPPNVEVALDGLTLGNAALGTQTAVDAGSHRVEARHEGVVYFTHTFDLAAKENVVVQIPEAPAGSASPPNVLPTPTLPVGTPTPTPVGGRPAARVESTVPPRAEPASMLERALPFVTLGLGASSMLVGGYFGLRAYQENREVERGCRSEPCNPALASVHRSAKRSASLSNWLIGSGAVVTAGSVYWLFTRGSGGQTAGALRLEASPHAARATVSGAF
jgi:hypothetical protein